MTVVPAVFAGTAAGSRVQLKPLPKSASGVPYFSPYRELFGSLLPTRTKPTLFTPLSAIVRFPSRVDFILRTTPPPPGIFQLWNFSVLMSNRTSTLGRIADSTYQIAPLR